jgi:uncharacterized protein (TIGR00297 family)
LRLIAGFLTAAAIAVAARRARSLSASGAVAATIIGTIAVAAGWRWGALLILYFVSSSLLSRFGRAEKERRTASIVEKGGERDAVQVLANGLVFAIAAAGEVMAPGTHWLALGAGSLAASAADTWATEIGTLYGKNPRSILTGRVVPVGTSGGISVPGVLATLAGSLVPAIVIPASVIPSAMRDLLLAGVTGSLIDSILGATVQSRRWCPTCERETERRVHDCGATTKHARGIAWLDNDAVNLLSNAAGGLLAMVLAR